MSIKRENKQNVKIIILIILLSSGMIYVVYRIMALNHMLPDLAKEAKSQTLTLNDRDDLDDAALYMQDINAQMKENIANGTITALKDNRDNKIYYVAQINNDIWMTQNLDYTPNDSSWNDDGILPGSGIAFADGSGTGHYSQGAYYNWEAANSACPSGWELPSLNQYATVAVNEGPDSIQMSPFYGVMAGNVWSSGMYASGEIEPNDIGINGAYWSSTEVDESTAYYLSLNLEEIKIDYFMKMNGYSVRCVAK